MVLGFFFVSDSFSHLKERRRELVQTTVQNQRVGHVAIATVSQSRTGCGGERGQMMGLLRSVVSAFFSLPLLKVWMELSKAVRPPPAPSDEDRGGGREESSVGGGGGGGGGGGAVWAPG